MNLRRVLIRIGAAAVLAAPLTPAWAVCDGCVVGAVQNAAMQITGAINSLAQSNASTTGNTSQQSQKAAEQSQRELEKGRVNAKYEVAPTACPSVAISQGVSEVGRSSPGRSTAGGGGAVPSQGAKQPSASMDYLISLDKKQVAAPAPEKVAQVAARAGCEAYSSSSDIRGRACIDAGYSTGASQYKNADISAETLMDGPQNPSNPRRMLTIKPSTPEYAAVEAYLHNLATPIEVRDLAKSELMTEQGRRYTAVKNVYDARMSLSSKPSRDWVASLTPDKRLATVVTGMIQNDPGGSSATFVSKYLAANYPNWQGDGISEAELQNLEAERRYLNGDWYKSIAAAAPEAVAREQLMVSAANAYLLQKLLEQQRQTNVLLGQIYGSSVRQEYQPQLMAAHRAATR